MIIKVLGPGCTNCVNLERVTRQAVDGLGVDATIEKVTDYPTIVGYGVMATPALVVDEKLVLSGRAPTAAQVRATPRPARQVGIRGRVDRPRLSGGGRSSRRRGQLPLRPMRYPAPIPVPSPIPVPRPSRAPS